MPELLQVVAQTCRRRLVLAPGTSVLVAVSGGPDSVALLHVLFALSSRLQLGPIGVAHLHHGIRGPAADADLEFVVNLASAVGAPCHTDKADVPYLAAEQGKSLEEAARHARYAFLAQVRHEHGYGLVATGHTQDDQAETLLLAMLRGAGPGGLGAMAYQTGHLVRPLLDATRAQVIRFLRAGGHEYRIDLTNSDTAYRRNRVRHELLPLLEEEYNPNIRATLARTAHLLAEEDAWLEGCVREALHKALVQSTRPDGVAVGRQQLASEPLALQRRVIRAAFARLVDQQPNPLTLRNVDDILRLLAGRTGASIDLPAGMLAELTYTALELRPTQRESAEGDPPRHSAMAGPDGGRRWLLPGGVKVPGLGWDFSAHVITVESAQACLAGPGLWQWTHDPATGHFAAHLDYDQLAEPLVARARRPGDRFRPHGGPGERKLKEFLIDAKIPRDMRARLPVLVDARGRIAGVLPVRPAEWAVVRDDTRRVLRLEGRIDNGPFVVKHRGPW